MQIFLGLPRVIATKRDVKKILFDKEQIRLFKKIKDAKSSLDMSNLQ